MRPTWCAIGLTLMACSLPPPAAAPALREVASDAPVVTATPIDARLGPPGATQGQRAVEVDAAEASGASTARALREPLVDARDTRAVVLLYHGFNRGNDPLSVSTANFERQLDWLEAHGVEIVHTSELIEFLEGKRRLPAKVAALHIDDGLSSVYEKAWPILRRRGVRFTVGLPTGVIENPKRAPVMTWDQVREMVASGLCEVASHGHLHRRLVGLEGRRLFEELELSWQLIEREIGRAPVAYLYPLGAYDRRAAAEVERVGYRAAFRASGAPIAQGMHGTFWLPRASVFHDDGPFVGQFFRKAFLAQVRARPLPEAPTAAR